MNNTLPAQPNTVIVIGIIKKIDRQSATLKIIQVKTQGQGIVNALSEGDELVVTIPKGTKNVLNRKVEVYLTERLEVDASQSTFSIITLKKLTD